jgi:agmatine deiminase
MHEMNFWMRCTVVALTVGALAGCGDGGEADPLATSAQATDSLTRGGYSVPAEWERQDTVWVAWWVFPYGGSQFPTEATSVELTRALTRYVPVDMLVQSSDEETHVREVLTSAGVNLARVRFHTIPHNDFWVRDTAGVFTRNRAGEVAVLDWGYDTWSYDRYTSPYSQHDERIDRDIAETVGVTAHRCSLIHEGGNTEVDGHGTAVVTETVQRRRNPHMTLSEMEREIKRCYGVRQVIWLPDGLVEDQAIMRGMLPGGVLNPGGTDGHVDAFMRFAPNNTILLAEVRREDIDRRDPGERQRALINRTRLEAAFDILRRARDTDGRPYRIVRVPMAELDYYDLHPGDPWHDVILSISPLEDGTVISPTQTLRIVSTTSYLNFFVTNGAVLYPAYRRAIPTEASARKDREVAEILRRAYPGRDIVPLFDSLGANRGAGGIHCLTQQQPASTNARNR